MSGKKTMTGGTENKLDTMFENYLKKDDVLSVCFEELKDTLGEKDFVFKMIKQELEVSWNGKEKHKNEYFSEKNVWLEFIAQGMSKITSSVLSLSIAATIFEFFKNDIIDFKIKLIITGIGIAILVLSAYVIGKHNTLNRNEDCETWVRHSVHFNKLRYLIIEFIEKKDKSDEAIQQFKEAVFELVNENIEQFKNNMMTRE